MRTAIITSAVLAGAVGATGLFGALAGAAQATTGQATQAQLAQPVPDGDGDDFLVADPEGASVRSGPGPEYDIVHSLDYGDAVQYQEETDEQVISYTGTTATDTAGYTATDTAGFTAMTEESASESSAAYVVRRVSDTLGPTTEESSWMQVEDGYVWMGDVRPE
ncbi:MAG TPA: SH3 domain-containing protein [Nonomuraea sp.]|nr:SH3 domain-containing protein [Nonomuraea sp.]